jgi:TRAP-type C4-dicarboxylate transport system substrate-binding protein
MSRLTALVIVFVAAMFADVAQAQTLKIATLSPDGTSWMKEMRKAAAEVAERTEGRVKLKFYPGGVMGGDKTVLRKIRIGQLQGGMITGGALAEIYPDAAIYGLPFVFHSYDEVDHVRRHMDARLLEGLRDRGFVSFGISEAGFSYLLTSDAVRTVDELKQRKVWVPEGDFVGQASLEVLGVSPVSLPLTDVLTGLETGLVDTVGNSPIGHIALQWHTRTKYLVDLPLLYLFGTIIVERKAFDLLRPQDQDTVANVMGSALARIGDRNRVDNENARDALQRHGILLVRPTEDTRRQWQGLVAVEMEGMARRGDFSIAMLEHMQALLRDHRGASGGS